MGTRCKIRTMAKKFKKSIYIYIYKTGEIRKDMFIRMP